MSKTLFMIKFIAVLFILSLVSSVLVSLSLEEAHIGNVAIIPIKGTIMSESSDSFFSDDVASAEEITSFINSAAKDERIKAIVLDINSPGGSPVASDEIANAIRKANKTTIAYIGDVGASGAYWVASSCDVVIANRMSITGSIGVIGSYLDFSGFLNRYNVTYQRLTSGKFKDSGTPFRKLSAEEERYIQNNLDIIHQYFIDEVAKNRNLSLQKTKELANGAWYLGAQAKELDLVDRLGNRDEVDIVLKELMNETPVYVRYEHKKNLFDYFSSVVSEGGFAIGQGIGKSLVENEGSIRV